MTDLFVQTRSIKALSLWQPWASLMARGVKLHETRHWATDYRGPIAIHAAKTLDLAGAPDQLCIDAFGPDWANILPRGALVAVGELQRVVSAESLADQVTRADHAAGNFAPGRFGWRIGDLRQLRAPIPLTGRQGLFNWTPPEDLHRQLGPVRDHALIVHQMGWA